MSQFTLYDLQQEAMRRSLARQQGSEPTPLPSQPVTRPEVEFRSGGMSTVSELVGPSVGGPQSIAPVVSPGMDLDRAVANVRMKLRETPAWQQLPPEEQNRVAQQIVQQQMAKGESSAFSPTLDQQAMEASSRIEAYRSGNFQYPPDYRFNDDIQVLEQYNQQRRGQLGQARAQDLGGLGAFALGAANTASLGAGSLIRSEALGQEELGQLEGQAFQESPIATIAGSLAGGLAPIGGASTVGATLGRGLVRSRAGSGLGRAVGGIGGAFAGGELAQAPIAFNNALAAGADPAAATQAAKEAALAYPIIASKLMQGEELNDQDWMDVSFLALDLIGAVPEMKAGIAQAGGAIGQVRESFQTAQAKRALARRLMDEIEATELMDAGEGLDAFNPQQAQTTDGVQQGPPRPLDQTGFNPGPVAVSPRLSPIRDRGPTGEMREATYEAVNRGIARPTRPEPLPLEGAAQDEAADQAIRQEFESLPKRERDRATIVADESIRRNQGEDLPARRKDDPPAAEEGPFPSRVSMDELAKIESRSADDPDAGEFDLEQAAEFQKGNIEQLDHRGEQFVKVSVPLEDLELPGKAVDADRADVQEYMRLGPEGRPPIAAGPPAAGELGSGKRLLVVDGQRRASAAMLNKEGTIEAYVPEWYAREQGYSRSTPATPRSTRNIPTVEGLEPAKVSLVGDAIQSFVRQNKRLPVQKSEDLKAMRELLKDSGVTDRDMRRALTAFNRQIREAQSGKANVDQSPENQVRSEAPGPKQVQVQPPRSEPTVPKQQRVEPRDEQGPKPRPEQRVRDAPPRGREQDGEGVRQGPVQEDVDTGESSPPPPMPKARRLSRDPVGPDRSSLISPDSGPRGRVSSMLDGLTRSEMAELIETHRISGGRAGKNSTVRDRIMKAYDEGSPELRRALEVEAERMEPFRGEAPPVAPRDGEESDLDVNREFAKDTLDSVRGDPEKIDFAEVSNAELMEIARLTKADTAQNPTRGQQVVLDQLQRRGLSGKITDAAIARQLRQPPKSPTARGPRGSGDAGLAGTPGQRSAGSPDRKPRPKARRVRKAPSKSATPPSQGPPVVGAGSVGARGASAQQQAAAVSKQGATMTDPISPHNIIADINRKLGLGAVGVGRHRMLKKNFLGFYRVTPEAIRLRMADALDTHLHEIGHHLHKMIFQGGVTVRQKNAVGLVTGLVDRFPAHWEPALANLGRQLYGNQIPSAGYVAEGWAELVRLAFTNSAAAKKAAPVAYKEMMDILAKDWPEVLSALEMFRKNYELYDAQSSAVKVASYIRRNSSKSVRWTEMMDKFRMVWFDRTQPLVRMKKDLGIDQAVSGDRDPHLVALRSFGRQIGDFDRVMKYGVWDPRRPGVPAKGKSLEEILRPAKDHMPELETYMIAKRALEKRAQGHQGVLGSLTGQQIREAIDEIEALHPEFKKINDEFQKLNRWLIEEYAVAHGLLTPEIAKKIVDKNIDYITMRKVVHPDEFGRGESGTKKFVDTGSGVRRFANFQGEQVEPPMEAFLAHMAAIMGNANQNRVGQSIIDLFYRTEGIGRWIDSVEQPKEVIRASSQQVTKELQKRLEQYGIDPDDPMVESILLLADADDFTVFRPGFRVDKNTRTFTVLVDGKPKFFEAKDKMLFEFLEGFSNPASFQGFARWFTLPRTVYRAGATSMNPAFFIVNFFRDLAAAMVFTSTRGKGFAEKSALATVKMQGMWKAFLSGDVDEMFIASGANMSGLFGEYFDPITQRLDMDKMFDKPRSLKHSLGASFNPRAYARHWKRATSGDAFDMVVGSARLAGQPFASVFNVIGALNERFELANRVAEFEGSLAQSAINDLKAAGIEKPTRAQILEHNSLKRKQGALERGELEQAGQAAADITLDFNRGGTLSRQINQFIPFFNAAMIGGDKLYREISKNPGRAMARVFEITVIPSIAAHMMNRNDEEYWNIPQELRDRYWHIPLGDPDNDDNKEYLRIPKPYGLGVFSMLTERAMAYADGIDPVTGRRGDPEAFDKVLSPNPLNNAILRDFRPPFQVPIVTPLVEIAVNYSFFFDNNIVYRGEMTGVPGERGAERSSELGAALGSFLNIPPPHVDHAISGLFASLGSDINRYALDPLIRTGRELAGQEPRERRNAVRFDQPEDFLIIKRLLVEEPKTFNETIARFYNQFSEFENSYRSWKQREENPDAQDAYYERHFGSIEAYQEILPYKTQMDKLFQELRSMYRDDGVGGVEFRRKTREVIDEINRTAREGMTFLLEADEQ